jgi:hypothetical protein
MTYVLIANFTEGRRGPRGTLFQIDYEIVFILNCCSWAERLIATTARTRAMPALFMIINQIGATCSL